MSQGSVVQENYVKCFIVYSSRKHVDFIDTVLNQLTPILEGRGFKPVFLGENTRSTNIYFNNLQKLIGECALGIVILDGLRPNVLYEFGYLQGAGKPVIAISSSNAYVSVRTLYKNVGDSGLTEARFKSLRNPVFNDTHFSDIEACVLQSMIGGRLLQRIYSLGR